MRCLVCGKQIGLFRRLWDRKFCCDRHRKTARKLSARAVRDARDFDELEEPWLITPGLGDERRRAPGSGVSPAAGVLLLVLIIFVVLVVPPSRGPALVPTPRNRSFSVLNKVQQLLPGAPTVDFQTDFRADLGDWSSRVGEATSWTRQAGKISFSDLNLWKPTLSMANYQMVFLGEIESKAMSWAFRAPDVNNYYATKIAVPGPGGPPRAEIVRYTVIDGKKTNRVELPLPMALSANTPYKIRVKIKDNRFSTLINGQVVDTWTDKLHSKGGVGFFAEPGERALISWIRVNDAEGLFGGLFSFSLLIGPSELMMGPPGRF